MSTATIPANDKQYVLDTVNQFPDSASLEEITDELAMIAAIRKGLADSDAGRLISHEEVKRRSATWITM